MFCFVHAGPGAALPNFAAKAGIKVLGSKPLRMLANKIAYYDKKQFATEDAMRIGRFVCKLAMRLATMTIYVYTCRS
jgi:hypothetical protein